LSNTEEYADALNDLAEDAASTSDEIDHEVRDINDTVSAAVENIGQVKDFARFVGRMVTRAREIEENYSIDGAHCDSLKDGVSTTKETSEELVGRAASLLEGSNNPLASTVNENLVSAEAELASGLVPLEQLRSKLNENGQEMSAIREVLEGVIGRLSALVNVQDELSGYATTANDHLASASQQDWAASESLNDIAGSI
jgi:chromosome segregation ATPase